MVAINDEPDTFHQPWGILGSVQEAELSEKLIHSIFQQHLAQRSINRHSLVIVQYGEEAIEYLFPAMTRDHSDSGLTIRRPNAAN
jgi:hypothetical protein